MQDDVAEAGAAEQELGLGAQGLQHPRQRVQRADQKVPVVRRILHTCGPRVKQRLHASLYSTGGLDNRLEWLHRHNGTQKSLSLTVRGLHGQQMHSRLAEG